MRKHFAFPPWRDRYCAFWPPRLKVCVAGGRHRLSRRQRVNGPGARLADGQPDVAGHWSNTIGNHNNLTDPQGPLGTDDEAPPGNGGQNARRLKPRNERAPSRITDPPDGQIPFQPWARAKQQEFLKYLNNPIKPEYVEPFARCAPVGQLNRSCGTATRFASIRVRPVPFRFWQPGDPSGWPASPSGQSQAMERRFAWPLGGQHASGGDHQQ